MPTIIDELRKSPDTKWLIHGKTLTEMNTPDNIKREIACSTQKGISFRCSSEQLVQLLVDNRINTTDWRIDEHAVYGRIVGHMIVEASAIGKYSEDEMAKLVIKSATKMAKETGAAVITAIQQTTNVPAKKSPKQVLVHLASTKQKGASACDNGPLAILTRILTNDVHAVTCKNCQKNLKFKEALAKLTDTAPVVS